MREIFVNLPVKDLDVAKRFYGELGFEPNPEFTGEQAAAFRIGEGSHLMALTEDFFRTFITDEVADTAGSTEVINCVSAASNAEVDELIERALAAGASEHKPVMEQGPMYGGSFKDPDGHVWEIMHMDMSG